MGIEQDITGARGSGVICGTSAAAPTLSELARSFGLREDPELYQEIDELSALRLARLILHQNMVYKSEIMPAKQAEELARKFLRLFGSESPRFYTNGTFHQPVAEDSPAGASWQPATDATVDTGVLILGTGCSGCLWVADEGPPLLG